MPTRPFLRGARPCRCVQPALETLESRLLLAGDVMNLSLRADPSVPFQTVESVLSSGISRPTQQTFTDTKPGAISGSLPLGSASVSLDATATPQADGTVAGVLHLTQHADHSQQATTSIASEAAATWEDDFTTTAGQQITITPQATITAPGTITQLFIQVDDTDVVSSPGGEPVSDEAQTFTLDAGSHKLIVTSDSHAPSGTASDLQATVTWQLGAPSTAVVAPTAPQWDSSGLGVTFGYTVSGTLSKDVQLRAYWSSSDQLSGKLGDIAYTATIPAGTNPGSYQAPAISPGALAQPLAGANYLLVVTDPDNALGNFDPGVNVQSLLLTPPAQQADPGPQYNVHPLRQYDPQWASTPYANLPNKTIQQKGCGLTSLAMALTYAGVSIDPAQLNALMNQGGGYTPSGDVDWGTATKKAANNAGQSDLIFHFQVTSSPDDLTAMLTQANGPVIVAVTNAQGKMHFVLVTGVSGDTFTIIDPGHANMTTLADYDDDFQTRGYLQHQPHDISDLEVTASSSAPGMRLAVTSPQGQVTGTDPATGQPLTQIPGSVTFTDQLEDGLDSPNSPDSDQFVEIFQPGSGNYTVQTSGAAAPAAVQINAVSPDGKVEPQQDFASTSTAGSPQTYQVNLDASRQLQSQPTSATASGSGGGTAAHTPMLFSIGLDSQVWFQTQISSGAWSGWQLSQPGQVQHVIATTERSGATELFCIGLDGQVWFQTQTAQPSASNTGGWSGWQLTQAGQVTQIAATTDSSGQTELFSIGLDGQVWFQNQTSAGAWSGWSLTQAGQVKQIAATTDGNGSPELFSIGLDGQVWFQNQGQASANNPSGWSGWQLTQAGQVSQITASTDSSGQTELFCIGLDGQVWFQNQTGQPSATNPGGWSGWQLTQAGQVSQIATTLDSAGQSELFCIGLDGQVWFQTQGRPSASNPGGWSGWQLTQAGQVKQIAAS